MYVYIYICHDIRYVVSVAAVVSAPASPLFTASCTAALVPEREGFLTRSALDQGLNNASECVLLDKAEPSHDQDRQDKKNKTKLALLEVD